MGRVIRRLKTIPIVCEILKMGRIRTRYSQFLGVLLPRMLTETMGRVLSSTGGTGGRPRAIRRVNTVPIVCEILKMGRIYTSSRVYVAWSWLTNSWGG
jgi:hypothetical protein